MENALSRAGRGAQTTRVLVKKAIFAAIYFAAALILEVAAFLSAGLGVLPGYFLLDLSVLLMVTLGVFIVPGFVAQIVVIGVLLFLEAVLCVVDAILLDMSNMVFSFSMLNIIGEAGNVFNPRMLLGSLGLVIFALLFYGGVLTGCIFLQKKMKTVPCFEWQTALLLAFTVVISASACFGLYSASLFSFRRSDVQDSLYKYEDDMYLYETQFLTAEAFKKFGFFGFYSKNFFNWLGSGGDEITREERDEQLAELDDYFEGGEWNSTLPANGYMAGRYRGKNVVLIVIESGEWYGINKDYTPTLYAMAKNGWRMSEYYARDKTNHSEALSVLGSYPAQLRNSIIPSGANGEGLLEHNFSFSLPHVMQSAGYTTNYFHANDSGFYSRGQTHGDLYGFENTHFLEDMSRLEGYYDKTWFYDFDRDSEMISQYLGAFTDGGENGRFYTMMLSLISHGHYDDLRGGDYPGEMTEEEKQQFSESCTVQNLETYYEYIDGYPTQYVDERFAVPHGERGEEGELTQEYLMFKRYQAGLMDLDVGVNRLVHYLEQTGELDNTLFVFYADHNRYYDEQSYYFKQVADGVYYDTSLYNIPFFIWDGAMALEVENMYAAEEYVNDCEQFSSAYAGEFYYSLSRSGYYGGEVTKPCSSLDVLPTLLDLLGFDFNTNLYQGSSVFRAPVTTFVSRESGIFIRGIYFDGEILYLAAEEEDGVYTSFDGQLTLYPNGRLASEQGGARVIYTGELIGEEEGPVYADENGFICIRFAGGSRYFPDACNAFVEGLLRYDEKQEMLEDMYRYDYFAYRDIADLVHVSV